MGDTGMVVKMRKKAITGTHSFADMSRYKWLRYYHTVDEEEVVEGGGGGGFLLHTGMNKCRYD